MQLTQLLERMNSQERAQLLRRRGYDAKQPQDRQTISEVLSRRESLSYALLDLDAFQHLVLRWLVERQGMEALWPAFMQEIDGRVPDDYLTQELRDLRLWGLLDFEAKSGGFVATYPAVAGALPLHVSSLRDHLARQTTETLRELCTGLGLKSPPSDKNGRMQVLISALSQADFCRSLLERLPERTRVLFDWMRQQGGPVTTETLAHRPEVSMSRHDLEYMGYYGRFTRSMDSVALLLGHGLLVSISDDGWRTRAFIVADEVARAFSGQGLFDTEPLAPPPLHPAEKVAGVHPDPLATLRDVGHLLGFISTGRCEWRQDGEPYQRSLQAFGKAIHSADKAYPEALWRVCVAAGLVRQRSPASYVASEVKQDRPEALFQHLLTCWMKGDTEPSYRRELARVRLLNLLGRIPPDTWVLKDSLGQLLAFVRPMLFRKDDGSDGVPELDRAWTMLRHFVVAEGVSASREAAILVPASLRAFLTHEQATEPAILPAWDDTWIVQPDRTVVAPPNVHPRALIDLWRVAEPTQNQGAAIFRLTSTSVAQGLNRGLAPADLKKLLQRRSRVPLPPTVERLLDDQGKRYGQIKLGPAQTYVRTDDPDLLAELVHNRKLADLHWQELGPGVACIDNVAPTSAVDLLRRAGYLPVLEEVGRSGRRGSSEPAPYTPHAFRELAKTCRYAAERGLHLDLRWTEAGRSMRETVKPIEVRGRQLHAESREDEDIIINLDAVTRLHIVGAAQDDEW